MLALLATLFVPLLLAALSAVRHQPVLIALFATDASSAAAAISWAPVLNALIVGLTGIVTLLVPLLGALLAQWLRSKLKSDSQRAIFDHVADLVHTEVRALMQSTVPEIRAQVLNATADGKITPEEAAKLRALVIDKVRLTLGGEGQKALQALIGDRSIDSFLTSVIESAVLQTKNDWPRMLDVPVRASRHPTPPAPATAPVSDAPAPESVPVAPLSTASGEVLR